MSDTNTALVGRLKELHLPTVRERFEEEAAKARKASSSFESYLFELMNGECEARWQNRIERYLRESRLPLEKSFENFDLARLPSTVTQHVAVLKEGSFLDRKENVLAFGNPGSGKTHCQTIS